MANSLMWQGFFIQIAARSPGEVGTLFERFGFKKYDGPSGGCPGSFYIQGLQCVYVTPYLEVHPQLTPCLDAVITRVGVLRQGARTSSPLETEGDLISPIGLGFFFMDETIWQGWLQTHLNVQDTEPALLSHLDHVAINLFEEQKEEMSAWCANILGLQPLEPFHISGNATRFTCTPLESVCGGFSVVLSTSDDPASQISQFLDEAGGAGVQHLAFATDDLHGALASLRARGVKFVDVPEGYYDTLVVEGRLGAHEKEKFQNAALLLEKHKDDDAYLAQTFTQNVLGPFFIEIISRHKMRGFGEGNVTALFKAVEQSYAQNRP